MPSVAASAWNVSRGSAVQDIFTFWHSAHCILGDLSRVEPFFCLSGCTQCTVLVACWKRGLTSVLHHVTQWCVIACIACRLRIHAPRGRRAASGRAQQRAAVVCWGGFHVSIFRELLVPGVIFCTIVCHALSSCGSFGTSPPVIREDVSGRSRGHRYIR